MNTILIVVLSVILLILLIARFCDRTEGLNIMTVRDVMRAPQREVGGEWTAARYIGDQSIQTRVKAAWLVFTGRADALIWKA